LRSEVLPDGHEWLRIADPSWVDPLDPSYAQARGGRWNPPASFPTLYFNEDLVTARLNLAAFAAGWAYQPEDLRNEHAPVLVGATIPANQRVADVHSRRGVEAAGLPPTYPVDQEGRLIPHDLCQPIGARAHSLSLRGVRARSARTPLGAGRELAWFPASARSRARTIRVLKFEEWFWS
jgi:hypothetical protein